MTQEEIKKILPHRDKMLLVDEAELCQDSLDENGQPTRCRGSYTIRGDEWFLQGHFPGNPIVPGVVQCEIIAQASCVLFAEKMQGNTAYYAGIDKVRFRRMVRPGDTLEITSTLLRSKLNVYVVKGEARVDGQVCASGEFSFIIP